MQKNTGHYLVSIDKISQQTQSKPDQGNLQNLQLTSYMNVMR